MKQEALGVNFINLVVYFAKLTFLYVPQRLIPLSVLYKYFLLIFYHGGVCSSLLCVGRGRDFWYFSVFNVGRVVIQKSLYFCVASVGGGINSCNFFVAAILEPKIFFCHDADVALRFFNNGSFELKRLLWSIKYFHFVFEFAWLL